MVIALIAGWSIFDALRRSAGQGRTLEQVFAPFVGPALLVAVVVYGVAHARRAIEPGLFFSACMQGNERRVRELLRGRRDVDERSRGMTGLWVAAAGGHLPVVKLLLDRGGRIDATDYRGFTPLMVAAANGRRDTVRYLIGAGADINATSVEDWPISPDELGGELDLNLDPGRWTPVMLAAANGHLEILKILVRAGARCTPELAVGSPSSSAEERPGECAPDLVRIQAPPLLTPGFTSGEPLCWILEGKEERFSAWLSEGGHPDHRDESGQTPLMYAVAMGSRDLTTRLVAAGADVNAVDHEGCTALMSAVWLDRLALIEMLIKHRADVDARCRHGFTPLMLAAYQGRLEAATSLLRAGANPQLASADGWTCESVARARGHPSIRRLLQRVAAAKRRADSTEVP
jgi:ankyrin repeat protein